MKILIFNWQDLSNPLAGGAEVHLHEVFSRIAKNGNDVTLFCSMYKCAKPEEVINGIKIIRCGNRILFNFLVPIKYFFKFKKQKFDIIIDDVNKIPFYTPCFVREPVVGVIHHLFGKSIFKEINFLMASYVFLAEKLAIKIYKNLKFIVGSPSTHKELLRLGFNENKTQLIYYGVDHTKFKKLNIPKSEAPLIGMLGRLKKYKCIDHLIEAFKIVKKEIPNAKLVIVGDGDDKLRLQSIVKKLNLESDVTFTGFVSEEEKTIWLNKIHIAVNSSAKEGWGLTVTEANACGTTTISSNVEGLRDAVIDNETGLLFEFGNINQLAEKIILVLKDENLRNTLENKALTHSRRFDWEIAADKTMKIIKDIIDEGKRKL